MKWNEIRLIRCYREHWRMNEWMNGAVSKVWLECQAFKILLLYSTVSVAWLMPWTSCPSVWRLWGLDGAQFQHSFSKTLAIPSDFGCLYLLVLELFCPWCWERWHCLRQTQYRIWRVLLDSWFLLKWQVPPVARRSFAHLQVVQQLHTFLDW